MAPSRSVLPGGLGLLLYAFFFLTGASALVYEIVWVRQLLLIVGTTTGAVSTALGVFMAGLGLGAWLFGPLADRSRAPLKLYAWLEAAVGTYALLIPFLLASVGPYYVDLARGLAGRPGAVMGLRVALGFVLLLPPTLCMGGTLPLLLRSVGRSEARLGRDIGALYGSNLAGAVCGSLLTGFVLIPSLGLHGTTLVAVCVNLGVSLAALAANESLTMAAEAPAASQASGSRPLPRAFRRVLWVVVFLSGLAGMAYEVLWARILIFSLSSTVYSFTVILATFLTGLGLGSAVFAFGESRWDRRRMLALAQIGAGLSAALLAPTGAAASSIIEMLSDRLGHSGAVFLLGSAACAALLLLLPATLMGIVFPLSMRLLVDDLARAGRRVGDAYLTNTLGSIVGSFGAGFLLLGLLGVKGALLLLAAAQLAAGWLVLPWCELAAPSRRAVLAGTAALFALALAGSSALLRGPSPWDPLLRPGPGAAAVIEAHHDGATASVSVVRRPTGRALHIDGFEATSTEARSAYMAMMTHLPMLLHPEPQRLLVICFGTGTTAGAGLLYPGVAIDAVDIDATVFRFASYFRDVNRDVARSPRARLVQDDGRNFLLTTRELYDVITLEPMPPRFAGVVNLYSREYYTLAKSRLRTGGFVVQWLPMHLVDSSESLDILRTVESVFPETTLWIHTGTGIIVAGRDAPVRIDAASIQGRLLANAELRSELMRLGVPDVARLVDLYTAGPRVLSGLTRKARLITDDRPSLEYHRPRHRESLHLGGREAEEALTRELLYRAWQPEELPLVGLEPRDEAALRAARDAWNHALLGDLYGSLGSWEAARVEYQRGLERARDPGMRAFFLFGLALAAQQQGRLADARRLVDEGLALAPENAKAQELRKSLANAPIRLP